MLGFTAKHDILPGAKNHLDQVTFTSWQNHPSRKIKNPRAFSQHFPQMTG